jgi:hypothetical protein
MDLWTMIMIVSIVAIATAGKIYMARLRANVEKSEGLFQELKQRIDRLEERMANIETIVLEKERGKKFSALEGGEN